MGYLGDLLCSMGDTGKGRDYYLTAILTDSEGIDIDLVIDDDVASLIKGTYISEGWGGMWAASVGHMLLVFSVREFSDSDELMDFYKEFIRLKSSMKKDRSGKTSGKLFYYALVIGENEGDFKALKETDKIEIRKLMRQLNPGLFKYYMKLILKREN